MVKSPSGGKSPWKTAPANPRRALFEKCFKSWFDTVRLWEMSCAFGIFRNYWFRCILRRVMVSITFIKMSFYKVLGKTEFRFEFRVKHYVFQHRTNFGHFLKKCKCWHFWKRYMAARLLSAHHNYQVERPFFTTVPENQWRQHKQTKANKSKQQTVNNWL